MIRAALRRYGFITVSIGLTVLAILLSVGISYAINLLLRDGPMGDGLLIAVLVPAIIASTLGGHTLHLINELDQAEERLQFLSNTDELTQTYNRRYFMQFGEQELKRAWRYGETFSIAIMDLDNFKAVNDQYGHLAGDQTLYILSQLCRNCMGEGDIFARYGGDEFIFLFPRANQAKGRRCASHIFETISSTPVQLGTLEIHLLLSMGVATFSEQTTSLDDLLAQADRALYEAKKSRSAKLICSWDE